jgi:hypothetical protein
VNQKESVPQRCGNRTTRRIAWAVNLACLLVESWARDFASHSALGRWVGQTSATSHTHRLHRVQSQLLHHARILPRTPSNDC